MASSKILLTKRTMGASSTSSRPSALGVGVVIAAGDLEILEIEVIVGQARHDRFGLIDGLVDRRLQLVVLDNDELDAHGGLKADLVEGVQIGRIGDRQEQPLAALH